MASVFSVSQFAGGVAGMVKAEIMAKEYGIGNHVDHVKKPPTVDADVVEMGHSDTGARSLWGTPMCFPLWVRISDTTPDWWLLPLEPIISISATNHVVKRRVAKSPRQRKRTGTIKEHWANGDYDISISGVLIAKDSFNYPKDDVRRLMEICEATAVDVKCELFEVFGIDRIMINKFDFPFTKGEENQVYRIDAVSDSFTNLLIKILPPKFGFDVDKLGQQNI